MHPEGGVFATASSDAKVSALQTLDIARTLHPSCPTCICCPQGCSSHTMLLASLLQV
jgi:hypothetical protein